MPATCTIPQLRELQEVPSTADHLAVMDALREVTSAPMRWDWPCEKAYYIADLIVGEPSNPNGVGIGFSCFGNLAFIYPQESAPLVSIDAVEETLNAHGWSVISDATARMDMYPEHGICVHDCFFNYL